MTKIQSKQCASFLQFIWNFLQLIVTQILWIEKTQNFKTQEFKLKSHYTNDIHRNSWRPKYINFTLKLMFQFTA